MNMKRMRGRGNYRGGGHGGGGQGGGGGPRPNNNHQPMNRNHVFDSIGPDMRMRGTAQQLFEKYLQLGRDATSSGDRVAAEGYFQHAEHYFRILGAMNQAQGQPQQGNGGYQQRRYQGNDDGQPPSEGAEEVGPVNGHAGPDGAHEEAETEARETLQ
jgi:hypothetical protein